MAILNILENPLVKITYVIIVGFIALPENFITDGFFLCRSVNCFIEYQFYWIYEIFIEPLQVK